MWLPTPVYERLPQFWLLMGLLFMSGGTYIGFDYTLSFAYFGVGFACVVWSLKVFAMRQRSRQDNDDGESAVRSPPKVEQADEIDHTTLPIG
jgi:hypothetical protein